MIPAISAASGKVMSFRFLLKYACEASPKPLIVNDPRWPRSTQFAYSSNMCSLLNFCSSSSAINISVSLRLMVFSGERKKPRASCMVRVELPCAYRLWAKSIQATSAMLKNSPVLNGTDCVHHHFRNLVVSHHLPLGTPRLKHGGDHHRLKFVCLQVPGLPADAGDFFVTEADSCWLGTVIRLRAGRDDNSIFDKPVSSHLRLAIGV